jgi:hypothetical protein
MLYQRGEAGLPRQVTPVKGPGTRVRTNKTVIKANVSSRVVMQRIKVWGVGREGSFHHLTTGLIEFIACQCAGTCTL